MIPSFVGSVMCFAIAMVSIRLKTVRVIIGVIGEFFVNIAFFSSFTWAAEIFPTHLRAGGVGILEVFECLGSSSSPWVAKGLQKYGDWVPFAVMGCPLLICSLLGILLPETKEKQDLEKSEVAVEWNEEKLEKGGEMMGSNNKAFDKDVSSK